MLTEVQKEQRSSTKKLELLAQDVGSLTRKWEWEKEEEEKDTDLPQRRRPRSSVDLPEFGSQMLSYSSSSSSSSPCLAFKSFHLKCFKGPIVEVEGPDDILGMAADTEIRVI